ncbi:MAG: hypothetical protein K6F49_01710 [Saccharofermentans sp.]|nr:hypothetical protein [Saccharofermentans sp.]
MNNSLRRIAGRITALILAVGISVSFLSPLMSREVAAVVDQPVLTIPTLDEVNCAAYCVYDKTADQIIMSKTPHNRVYPASMTKIMTAQLALDYLDTDAYLTVSQNALDNVTSDSTLMYVTLGEELKVSELLYGLMLPSGNDAANVLAEGVIDAMLDNYPVGGDAVGPDGVNSQYLVDTLGVTEQEIRDSYKLSAFAELMNLRANNIGCTGTHFVNAHGLHSDEHYTTASDLTKIMASACQNPDFCTVISSPTHIFAATNAHPNDAWSIVTNSNKILSDPWLCATTPEGEDTHITAFIGGKTGTTSIAGTGMTTYSVNENGHELFISVCGIPSEEYSNQTIYVASVVAYGNLTCWNNDPTSVLPGTTGDYRRSNSTTAELPMYDPLIVPGDTIDVDYMPEGYTPPQVTEPSETDPSTEETDATVEASTEGSGEDDRDTDSDTDEDEGEEIDKSTLKGKFLSTSVGKFVHKRPFISGVAVGLMILIIVIVAILIVRSVSNNKKRRRKARPYNGNVSL